MGRQHHVHRLFLNSSGLPVIWLSSYATLYPLMKAAKPTAWVSITDPAFEYPEQPLVQHSLLLKFHDFVRPCDGLTLCKKADIRKLIDFALRWDGSGALVVSCQAGQSRSAAACMIVLAARFPHKETEVVNAVRSVASWIRPNPLMLALADELLNAEGRLISALANMTRATTNALLEPALIRYPSH